MLAQEIYSSHTDQNDEPDWAYTLGVNGVTKIERETENLGDHGLGWFHVYQGERLCVTVAARSVARIIWKE